MTTDSTILGILYTRLNTPEMAKLLSGTIWKVRKPANRRETDIVIGMLQNITHENSHLNNGIININTYIPLLQDSTVNTTEIEKIHELIIKLLACTYNYGHIDSLHYRIISQRIFMDAVDDKMCFSNIKLSFSHKN